MDKVVLILREEGRSVLRVNGKEYVLAKLELRGLAFSCSESLNFYGSLGANESEAQATRVVAEESYETKAFSGEDWVFAFAKPRRD